MRFFKILYSSALWGKAIYFSGKSNYEKSLYFLNKAIKYSANKDGKKFLLKGFLLGAMGKDKEAMDSLECALVLIRKSKIMNDDEKKYLCNYAADIVLIMGQSSKKMSYGEYWHKNVSQRLLDNFPLKKKTIEAFQKQ